jgi:hypothetical protein
MMSKDNYLNITNHIAYIKLNNTFDTWMMFEINIGPSYNENHGWIIDLAKINEDFINHQMIVKIVSPSIHIEFYKNSWEKVSEENLKILLEKTGDMEAIYENTISHKLYRPNLTHNSTIHDRIPRGTRISNNKKTSAYSSYYDNDLHLTCYEPI